MLDLTKGDEGRVLIRFTIPMFISVVFQQLYNMADSLIAGKFAGENALAAVGASYPVTMILMAFALGTGIGTMVIISNLYGARSYEKLKTAVSTIFISTIVLSIVLTLLSLGLSSFIMERLNTPENIFKDSLIYLNIYIYGFIFLFLYNIATGIFTSIGDSRTPLYFLIGSSLGNILLDYIFVAKFNMGVAGVAWATLIAQSIACILSLLALRSRLRDIPSKTYEKFSLPMLKDISMIAGPSILQQSFISIGNIFIQGRINAFGSSTIAGFAAANKLNMFIITSFTTIGNGISSFTAQNLGANKEKRVENGFKAGLKMALTIGLIFFGLFFFFGDDLVSLFIKEKTMETIEVGHKFLKIVSPFYLVIAIKLTADGVLRGSKSMKRFMISTFVDLIARVVLAFVLSDMIGSTGIWISWPAGWIMGALLSLSFYFSLIKNYRNRGN